LQSAKLLLQRCERQASGESVTLCAFGNPQETMAHLTAIIGGSSLAKLPGLQVRERRVVRTPYGETSSPLLFGKIEGASVVFVARHGHGHTIAPHRVNYRANLWALQSSGVTRILAVSSVGGIAEGLQPRDFAVPSQIIDYTGGRDSTFFEGPDMPVTHIDFTEPFDPALRAVLVQACDEAGKPAHTAGATYGVTSGPRFETAAEIRRMQRDGCDMVGMTAMPEAALARELELEYALLAVVSNRAAGLAKEPFSIDAMRQTLDAVLPSVQMVLSFAARLLQGEDAAPASPADSSARRRSGAPS
jgi:5'-methylthioinosine phosphorylase